MVGIITNIGVTLGYTLENTIKRPGLWFALVGMAILTALVFTLGIGFMAIGGLPLNDLLPGITPPSFGIASLIVGIVLFVIGIFLCFFFEGIAVQILANKEITFKGFFATIGKGFQIVVISIIYSIIIGIITAIIGALGIFGGAGVNLLQSAASGNVLEGISQFFSGMGVVSVICFIVLILIEIFFSLFLTAAEVNFARGGKFGAGFRLGEIFGRIGKLGWIKYILAFILFVIVMIIISAIVSLILFLFTLIPVAGGVISAVVGCLFVPFIWIFGIKYWGNLFEE